MYENICFSKLIVSVYQSQKSVSGDVQRTIVSTSSSVGREGVKQNSGGSIHILYWSKSTNITL